MKVGDNLYLQLLFIYETFLNKDLNIMLRPYSKKILDEFKKVHNDYIDRLHPPFIYQKIDEEKIIKFYCYDMDINKIFMEEGETERLKKLLEWYYYEFYN